MARYIDADKVMEEIASMGGHDLCEWSTLGVKALIERQPTIDVVPRAEVAREIFEEIEELLDKYYDEDERAYYPVPRYDLWLGDDIAELKKKYTEPEPPEGD